MLMTTADLAELFDVTERTIRNWDRRGMHVARAGAGRKVEYDAPAAFAWRLDDLAPGEEDAYRIALTRRVTAQAAAAETKNRERDGELVERAYMLATLRQSLLAVDRTLKAAPRKHARRWAKVLRITEAEALELIEALVEDVRADLRRLGDAA